MRSASSCPRRWPGAEVPLAPGDLAAVNYAVAETDRDILTAATIQEVNRVWREWNVTSSTSATITTNATTTITSTAIWGAWNDSLTCGVDMGTTGASSTIIWTQWNGTYPAIAQARLNNAAIENRIARINGIQGAAYVPPKKTEAEIQAELKRQQEWEKQRLEREAEQLAAKQKAEKLLLDNLSAEQRETLVKRGFFYLHLQNGKKYRLDRHTHGNVYLVDEANRVLKKFCAQPNGVPVDDAILAQKLTLELDEPAFLRVANEHRL